MYLQLSNFLNEYIFQITPVETSEANLNGGSLDQDESLDLSETRERKNKWPIVEVAVSSTSSFFLFSFVILFEVAVQ